jgi:hypothetical protein
MTEYWSAGVLGNNEKSAAFFLLKTHHSASPFFHLFVIPSFHYSDIPAFE